MQAKIVGNREDVSVQVRQVGRWTYEIAIKSKDLIVNGQPYGLPRCWGRTRAERLARRELVEYLRRFDPPKVVAEFRPGDVG